MYIPHTINEDTITVILKGKDGIKAESIPSSHPIFAKIKALLIRGNHDEVPALVNIRKGVENMGGGDLSIVGNRVLYRGKTIPDYQAKKLISMHRDGHKNIKPFENFIKRLMSNPSARAQEEFARFADYKELPFDEDGFVYAWRGLQSDYWSKTGNVNTVVLKGKVNSSGQIYNGVGEEIEVARSSVDDNCNRTCSFGVHAGSFDYGSSWGSGGKVVLVKFDPKDVVSVPTDCNGQKVRICHYWVVSDYIEKKPIEQAIISDKKNSEKIEKKNKSEYLKKIKFFIGKYKLRPEEFLVAKYYMNESGFNEDAIIKELFDSYITACKINRYIDRQGGQVSFKRIQSAMKSYRLKYNDIQYLLDEFGHLT